MRWVIPHFHQNWALHIGWFLLRKCDLFLFVRKLLCSSVASILHLKLWGSFLAQEKKLYLSWIFSCRSLSASGPFRRWAYLFPSDRFAFCSWKPQHVLWNLICVCSEDIFHLSMELFFLMLLFATGISRASRKVHVQVRLRSCFLVQKWTEQTHFRLSSFVWFCLFL